MIELRDVTFTYRQADPTPRASAKSWCLGCG